MQIHEIFRRRTNEGILKGVKTLPPRNDRGRFMPVAPTAVFNNMATNLQNQSATTPATPVAPTASTGLSAIPRAIKSHVKSAATDWMAKQLGVDPSQIGQNNPYGNQEQAAATAAAPVIKVQAERSQKLWNDAVTKLLQQNNVQYISQLPAATKSGLQTSLMNQLHKTFLQSKLGRDYRKLPENVDPSMVSRANATVQQIGQSVQKILSMDPKYSLDAWKLLIQAAYDATNMLQFNSGSGSGARATKKSGASNPPNDPAIDQAAQQIVTASGITQPQLQQVQNIVGKLPDAETHDPRTQAYLKALGFNTP